MTQRLTLLPAHHALYLLKCSMGPVRMIYRLRTARCYLQTEFLRQFDKMIIDCLSRITNVNITEAIWMQAALPVAQGGLGIRSIEKLALPTFLASAYSVAKLTNELVDFDPEIYCRGAAEEWQQMTKADLPAFETRKHQKIWDEPIIHGTVETLLAAAQSDMSSEARLRGVSTKDNGAWLEALPAASLGNFLNDTTLRIAVGLRLGVPVTIPHRCNCGEWADARGYHGLSCKKSRRRKPRHSCINVTLKRAFASAGIETELEPSALQRSRKLRPVRSELINFSPNPVRLRIFKIILRPLRSVNVFYKSESSPIRSENFCHIYFLFHSRKIYNTYTIRLEPPGTCLTNGKRPDGVTLVPWERGKMLTWDATCVCTVALSHIAATSKQAGAAAARAEQDKVAKYRELTRDYLFRAFGVETLGPLGPDASHLVTEVGKMIQQETGEVRATEFLRQRISIDVQRGNAASVMGTAPASANLDEMFCVIRPPISVRQIELKMHLCTSADSIHP
ncbi:uncharacterized protein LOC129595388 [Paramacrobiotus metropolitanus]|uniref:uncharacterized protein LOC129595388 n=1 Tax=Paramacrobiotus metropolitanus TaxID=2943436 RepID=UPI002445AFF4|nr:uncharacterized protein LOC129595388 [Paramacrobiotus metropolitanus]